MFFQMIHPLHNQCTNAYKYALSSIFFFLILMSSYFCIGKVKIIWLLPTPVGRPSDALRTNKNIPSFSTLQVCATYKLHFLFNCLVVCEYEALLIYCLVLHADRLKAYKPCFICPFLSELAQWVVLFLYRTVKACKTMVAWACNQFLS